MQNPGQNLLYQDYNAPSLSYQKTWSATDMYYVMPDTATWATNVLTFNSRNHNLVSGDTVSIVSNQQASLFTATNLTVTVVSKDVFTVPMVSNPGSYDRSAGTPSLYERLTVTCSKYSKLMFKPSVVQVDALPAGVTVVVQSKVHPDADWITDATITTADGASTVEFSPVMNLVRISRTVGSGQPVAYAQY